MKIPEEMKIKLVAQIQGTYTVPTGYPVNPETGKQDFRAKPISFPVSENDIRFLVDLWVEAVENGTSSQDAIRVTYGCLYQTSGITFAPHARIAELRTK